MNVNFGLFPSVEIKKPEGHEGRWRGKEKVISKKHVTYGYMCVDLRVLSSPSLPNIHSTSDSFVKCTQFNFMCFYENHMFLLTCCETMEQVSATMIRHLFFFVTGHSPLHCYRIVRNQMSTINYPRISRRSRASDNSQASDSTAGGRSFGLSGSGSQVNTPANERPPRQPRFRKKEPA